MTVFEKVEASPGREASQVENNNEFQQNSNSGSNFSKADSDEKSQGNSSGETFENSRSRSEAVRESYERQKEDSNQSRLTSLTFEELTNREIPSRQFVLSPWIPECASVMVYSKPGIGKTYLGLSIALAAASGAKLFDWTVPRPRKVLYLDGEMHEGDLQIRVKKLASGLGKSDLKNLRFINGSWLPLGVVMPDLATIKGQKALEEQLVDVEFVVLDNLSTLVRTGRDNDAEAWRPVQQLLLNLRWKKISVLIIHHAGKASDGDGLPIQRGSSAREIVLEAILALKRPKNYSAEDGCVFEGHFTKFRNSYGSDAAPFEARLLEEDDGFIWKHRNLKLKTYDRVVDLFHEGVATVKEIADELGISRQAVEKHLKNARENGDIPSP